MNAEQMRLVIYLTKDIREREKIKKIKNDFKKFFLNKWKIELLLINQRKVIGGTRLKRKSSNSILAMLGLRYILAIQVENTTVRISEYRTVLEKKNGTYQYIDGI